MLRNYPPYVNCVCTVALASKMKRREFSWDRREPGIVLLNGLAIFLISTLPLRFFFYAIVNFSTPSILYHVAVIILRYPFIVGFLNFTATLLVALSLQLVAPFLPDRVKKQCESRPHCVWFIEVIFLNHVLLYL